MESTIPSLPQTISFNSHEAYEIGGVLIPILRMDKLRG